MTATVDATLSTVQGDGGGDGKTITTPGSMTGKRLLVFVGSSSNADTITAPGSGTWAEVDPSGDKVITTSGGQLRTFEGRLLAASTAYAFTLSGGRRTVVGCVISGHDDSGASMVDVSGSLESAAASTHTPPSVTPTASSELVVDCMMFRQFNPDTSTGSPPASGLTWTELYDGRGADGNNNVQMNVASATAGSSGVAISTAAWNTDDPFEPAMVMRVVIKSAAGGTTVNAESTAVTVAANSATLASAPQGGNAAVAAAANAATLAPKPAAGNAAVGAAAAGASLQLSAAAGNAAVGAASGNVTLTSAPAAASSAVSAAASSAGVASSFSSGFAAVAVGAADMTLTIAGATPLPVTVSAVAVGAFDVTLLGGDQGGGEGGAVTGGWQGLLDVLNDIRATLAEERAAPLVACPVDGEPLQSARGVMHCRFCGRQYVGNEQL